MNNVFRHEEIAQHLVDGSNFKILACGYVRYKDRKIAEALYIRRFKIQS